MDKNTVYEDKYFKVISPDYPLNCRDDGGHLILMALPALELVK
jgi:hypothetical protein